MYVGWYWWQDVVTGKGGYAFKGRGKSKGEGAWAQNPLNEDRFVRVSWPFLSSDYENWQCFEADASRRKTTIKLRGRASTGRWADTATYRTLVVYGETHQDVLHTFKSVLTASIPMGLKVDALPLSTFWRQAIGEMTSSPEACPHDHTDVAVASPQRASPVRVRRRREETSDASNSSM